MSNDHNDTSQPTVGWQPIETAPRTGELIVIVDAGSKSGGVMRWWTAAQYKRIAKRYREYHRDYDYEDGWGDAEGMGHPDAADAYTHWMPLPDVS